MFARMLSIENTKIYRRWMLWIEMVCIALLVLVLMAVMYTSFQSNDTGNQLPPEARASLTGFITWPSSLVNAIGLATGNNLGGVLLIILVGAVTAQEYTWRTFHLSLSRGVKRPTLLAAKFTAVLMPALLIVLAALLAGALFSAYTSLQITGSLQLDKLDFGQLLLSVLRTAYTLLPYGSMAFLLAIASRSAVVAIGAGLAYALLLESVILKLFIMLKGSLAELVKYTPSGLANGLMALNRATSTITMGLNPGENATWLQPIPAAVGIALWTLLFLGIAMLIFQKQDLSD